MAWLLKKKLNYEKIFLVQVWAQMSFAPGTKVWDVKGQMQKLIVGWQKANNEWANTMASGDFPCICPWNEEANRFSHVSWRNTDWLRWLKENMVNRMANGRFLVSPCNTKANIFFHVSWKGLKSHWLVGMAEWEDGQWEIPMHSLIKWRGLQTHFLVWHEEGLIYWDGWMGRRSKSIFQHTPFPGATWINYWRGIDWLKNPNL